MGLLSTLNKNLRGGKDGPKKTPNASRVFFFCFVFFPTYAPLYRNECWSTAMMEARFVSFNWCTKKNNNNEESRLEHLHLHKNRIRRVIMSRWFEVENGAHTSIHEIDLTSPLSSFIWINCLIPLPPGIHAYHTIHACTRRQHKSKKRGARTVIHSRIFFLPVSSTPAENNWQHGFLYSHPAFTKQKNRRRTCCHNELLYFRPCKHVNM